MNENKQISIKDIASVCGVSIATVSRIINDKGGYSKKTEEKVRAVIDSYGFISNMTAKSLRESKSHTIGLIVPDISNDFFSTIALHVEKALSEKKYSVFICNSANDVKKEQGYFHSLVSKCVDGIICISGLNKLTKEIAPNHIPIVCIDRYPENDFQIPRVSSDDIDGSYIATSHLIQKGCKHILYISSYTADYEKREREIGYQKALNEHGIKLDKNYLLYISGKQPSSIEAEILTNEFISEGLPFDGIFATSDHAALGALYALKRKNIRVPEDVKIIGFDNSLYSRLPSPSISTIARHPDKLAQSACDVLINMINHEEVAITTTIPVDLLERESSK